MMHPGGMHAQASADFTPESPEEAVLLLAMQVGKRMRLRHPGDEVDAATVPLLHVLARTDTIRLSDLAQRMRLDASTVSRHARQLEERGLIARTDDPDDRRAARVAITSPGREVLAACMRRRQQRLAQVLRHWPAEERARLQEVATRLAGDLAAGDDVAASADGGQVVVAREAGEA
jgi:DNA-binding MarR family transcriptional regulator